MRDSRNSTKNTRRARGCLTAGLSVLALVAMIGGEIAWELSREPNPTAIDVSQDLPAFHLASDGAQAVGAAPPPGQVVLEVEGVNLTVVPAPAGSPIRVTGSYDAARFAVTPEFSTDGERGWTYRLELRGTGLINPFMNLGGPGNTIRITLPRDIPFALSGLMENGNSDLELGGLWIVRTDLRLKAGDHRVHFSEPLRVPMDRLDLDVPLGELTVLGLGNASPREVGLRKKLGTASLDLQGAWRSDTSIALSCGVATCDLHAPAEDEAVVRFSAGDEAAAPAAEPSGLPVIQVRATGVFAHRVEIADRLETAEDDS